MVKDPFSTLAQWGELDAPFLDSGDDGDWNEEDAATNDESVPSQDVEFDVQYHFAVKMSATSEGHAKAKFFLELEKLVHGLNTGTLYRVEGDLEISTNYLNIVEAVPTQGSVFVGKTFAPAKPDYFRAEGREQEWEYFLSLVRDDLRFQLEMDFRKEFDKRVRNYLLMHHPNDPGE